MRCAQTNMRYSPALQAALQYSANLAYDRRRSLRIGEVVMSEMIEFKRPDGKTCPGYLATPKAGAGAPEVTHTIFYHFRPGRLGAPQQQSVKFTSGIDG